MKKESDNPGCPDSSAVGGVLGWLSFQPDLNPRGCSGGQRKAPPPAAPPPHCPAHLPSEALILFFFRCGPIRMLTLFQRRKGSPGIRR